jgi:hypothetical protein
MMSVTLLMPCSSVMFGLTSSSAGESPTGTAY